MERVLKRENGSASSQRVAQGKFTSKSRESEAATSIDESPLVAAQRKRLDGLFGGAIQRQEGEEELLQGKFDAVQRVEEEELLQGRFEAVQRVEEDELLQGKFEAVQRVDEEEPLQGKFEAASSAQLKEEAAKPNDTGLPDNLKNGIESLSGMSMDNVKVHYNSSKPAQLNALAYAQGSDIHIASGQEQHLPHEAWHVVQQAQGRVRPTMQMKEGVPVNDDQSLEHEADVMGGKAVQMAIKQRATLPAAGGPTAIQRKRTSKVTEKDINKILSRMENESLREELRRVATRLINDGSLWFDDAVSNACAYPDPQSQQMVVVIPERGLLVLGDKQIERDAITIHELIHAAEVMANTGGDFGNLTGNEMESDMVALGPILKALFTRLDNEKSEYESVSISLESVPFKDLYLFALERLNYADRLVTHHTNPSTREFPTVISQIIHVIDKKAPKLKSGEFYQWLEILQMQAAGLREVRRR